VEREGLDAALRQVGDSPLGRLIEQALDHLGPEVTRVIWVPDGDAHGLPLHAVRVNGRYLIERVEVVCGFGGGLLVKQATGRRGWWRGGRPAVVIDAPDSLPAAAAEGAAVAGRVRRCRVLRGADGTKAAVAAAVRSARVAHFACHAEFDPAAPLSAAVRLPAGERWGLPDWTTDAPPRLAVLAACRSGEVGEAAGREVFGLTAGALAAGVGGVVSGLWPVADQEAITLVAAFYRHLARRDPCAALAAAQREAIARPDATPLHWAVFALFGDPHALPAPPWWARWLFYR
jgi:CHAT domain-containing protein